MSSATNLVNNEQIHTAPFASMKPHLAQVTHYGRNAASSNAVQGLAAYVDGSHARWSRDGDI